MANEQAQPSAAGPEVEAGSYELIRARLVEQAKRLGTAASTLNERRKEVYGGTELSVIGNARVRTDNNCVPRDIRQVGGQLLFGFNVFVGLRREIGVGDVFSVHHLEGAESLDLATIPSGSPETGFLDAPQFQEDFHELYRFYKETHLVQLTRDESKLLAVFQIGKQLSDVRVFRWGLDANGQATYIDNRGERDFVFPPAHDFEWTATTREDHVSGRHPHISVLDEVFVETVGGDLTIKVENNTEDGEGIYNEPVEQPNQRLDDAEVSYAKVGTLILLRIRPYREERWRFLVYATRAHRAVRIDAIGQACVELPEDHGIVFPGGYYLQDGSHKVFDGDFTDYEFQRALKAPNGEDVLYVFHRKRDGHYALLPYNLIRKEIQNPIHCHGYSLFDDGRMVVFRSVSDEPTRVHPMQLWSTPFVSADHAAAQPQSGGTLQNIGNAELVRGISDAYSIKRAIEETEPSRQIYEDLIAAVTRCLDSYYWLGEAEVFNLGGLLAEIRETAELIVDEFVKVVALRQRATQAVDEARAAQEQLTRALRPDSFSSIDQFMGGLTALRNQRGKLISLRELRYVDMAALQELEDEVVERFEGVSRATVEFLLDEASLAPLSAELEELLTQIEASDKTNELSPLGEKLEATAEGLTLTSEVVGGLQVEDPAARTAILERIGEVFSQVNRVRATYQNRRKELLGQEGRAEFAAQFQLFSQSVTSAMALCDTPERCDEQLSRLMLQLEELEARFGEFDEFIGELSAKREEVYEVLERRKQQLLDERARRAQTLMGAAERILSGVARRAKGFGDSDELNAYFASDPMILKLQELCERLDALGDGTRADEVRSRLKSAKQDALRGLRDRTDLYEEGAAIIKLGRHRFAVNTEALELTLLPHGDGLALSLSGTHFQEPVEDAEFERTRDFWDQQLVSETPRVYRSEYLAASLLFAAETHTDGLSLGALRDAERSEEGLLPLVRTHASQRFDEGYERGLHDADAALILEKLLHLRDGAGLLRFSPDARAWACLYWAFEPSGERTQALHRRAVSLGHVRAAFEHTPALRSLAQELASSMAAFYAERQIEVAPTLLQQAGQYLAEELTREAPRFVASAGALKLKDGLLARLEREDTRRALEADLVALEGQLKAALSLSRAWLEAYLSRADTEFSKEAHLTLETAVLLLTEQRLDREPSSAVTELRVEGLLGQHPRIQQRGMDLRLDEALSRLGEFATARVPGYRAYRKLRQELLERERERLRLGEYMPRVLSSFVRNKLINDVYLPIIGDNLSKQLGAVGEGKRTDLMGLLLLISPPGYGKTTLMEYIASRLGLVFMKVNGPSLGHGVHSLDPAEAPNATARQEVDKINLAFEMGNNVMLYLDDIQHTHPELLQKFISLCDAQRRVEGVWKGRTRTYDLRGRRFCVVMAGNPYTESGDKFQVPDMLANRADIYNLGDILGGQDEAFGLSYIENAITSNAVLAPLGTRDQQDIYRLVKMALGEEVPTTDLSHGYSRVELDEITAVLGRLFQIRDVLLAINQQYIASAAMDDNFRTEPPFKLQGSYRNMNKLAEKVVAAMNEGELQQLIEDHYLGEAQTLTTGAEQNLLKLAELRGVLSAEQEARWTAIKKDFQRVKSMGGAEDDPVTRVTGQLGSLGTQLEGIRETLARAAAEADSRSVQLASQVDAQAQSPQSALPQQLGEHLARLDAALAALAQPKLEVTVQTDAPAGIDELLGQQVAIVERTLVPLVQVATRHLSDTTDLSRSIGTILGVTRAIAERIEDIQQTLPGRSAPGSD